MRIENASRFKFRCVALLELQNFDGPVIAKTVMKMHAVWM